jgi:ribonuclease HII
MCLDLDREYPVYGIAKNKGYGSKAHMDALREHGPSPIHRTKFIRFLDEEK